MARSRANGDSSSYDRAKVLETADRVVARFAEQRPGTDFTAVGALTEAERGAMSGVERQQVGRRVYQAMRRRYAGGFDEWKTSDNERHYSRGQEDGDDPKQTLGS